MRTRSKLILAGLAATLLMSLAVSSASAAHLSTSNQNFRITWTNLELTEPEGATLIRCPITMEGTFHSATIAKNIGLLIGYVTRATVNSPSCTGGGATINQASLPWHITYEGFTTELPNIRTIELLLRGVNFSTSITFLGIRITCGYGRPEENARGALNREASGALTSLTPERGIRLANTSGGGACPGSGGFAGNSLRPTVLGATTAITVTLI